MSGTGRARLRQAWRLGAALLLALHAAAAQPQEPMNVLFFGVDDLRAQLHFMGDHPAGAVGPRMRTPNFDRLAARALRLNNARVQQAVCSPTRTSLLTSRRPDTTRVYDLYTYFREFAPTVHTIPQIFKDVLNYTTIGMGKLFHPGHASGANATCPVQRCGDDSLYSWSVPYWHAPNLDYWSGTRGSGPPQHHGFDAGDAWAAVPDAVREQHPLPDEQIADHAVDVLGNMTRGSPPWFLGVGFHKPHLPFIFPESYLEMYPQSEVELPQNPTPPSGMPDVAWSSYAAPGLLCCGQLECVAFHVTVGKLQQIMTMHVTADTQLGKVLDALEASPFANNTIVSVFGDHGWQLGEWCKHTNFALATHAPLLVAVPGKTDRGIDVDVPVTVEFVDLMPTLTQLAAGFTPPSCPAHPNESRKTALCTEGVSLAPLISRPTTPLRAAAFSQYPRGWQKLGALDSNVHEGGTAELRQLLDESNPMSTPQPSACIVSKEPGKPPKCCMGYSMETAVDGIAYRYTNWVHVEDSLIKWNESQGVELYDHSSDAAENENLAADSGKAALVAKLQRQLEAGWASPQNNLDGE